MAESAELIDILDDKKPRERADKWCLVFVEDTTMQTPERLTVVDGFGPCNDKTVLVAKARKSGTGLAPGTYRLAKLSPTFTVTCEEVVTRKVVGL